MPPKKAPSKRLTAREKGLLIAAQNASDKSAVYKWLVGFCKAADAQLPRVN